LFHVPSNKKKALNLLITESNFTQNRKYICDDVVKTS